MLTQLPMSHTGTLAISHWSYTSALLCFGRTLHKGTKSISWGALGTILEAACPTANKWWGGIPADIWLRSQRASPRRSAASWWENMPFPHKRGKRGCYEGSKTKNSGEPWIKSLNFYFFPLWTWTKRYSFRFIISSHLPPRSQLSW